MKKTKALLALAALFIVNTIQAQDLDIATRATSFYNNTVKPLFPIVLGVVFVISMLMNIGLILDEQNRNWRKFFTMILMYVGSALLLMVVINFLATLSL